jgi:type I restriction enzyme M protein
MPPTRLEASVTHSICTQLGNLGWIVDESSPQNNVTQQRTKTDAERKKLKDANDGKLKFPDFVLYERGTSQAIAIIEAKKPGESLEKALKQAEDCYARPLNAPLIFAYNDTFVATRYLHNKRALKIDGEDIRQFVDHYTSLRFVNEGPEILSAPEHVQVSREELIRIFKRQANYLREAGLQAGLERFGAFSDVLFLKLMDELSQIREHAGSEAPMPKHLRWSEFQDKKPKDRLDYVRDVVWKEMNKRYGAIFSHAFPIQSPDIFDDMVQDLSRLNFTGTDVDVKGDAFEYFLKNAYQGIKIKDLGEYFTPRNIVRTMVSMVDPKIGDKVYDPFCGTGGFLIEAFRYISLRTKLTPKLSGILKEETIYGSEITVTARVARMNMILYGDGHSNVHQQDSFANPKNGEFDIVLTNPPYSQPTRHGNLYPIPSESGDAIAMEHCLKALAPNGRAAILVKEDFLTEGGDIGKVRDMMLNTAKNFSIVSLPRRLFEPYTPTKTSIIYLEKNGKRNTTFFFVVRNVGHTFGARKQSQPKNDLPNVLSAFNSKEEADRLTIEHAIIDNDQIKKTKNSLWIYDYIEVVPPIDGPLESLGEEIEPSGMRFKPLDEESENFHILGVSNTLGIFSNEEKTGGDIKQTYIKVKAGDLVYNPHRVNVGSLGLVPKELDGGIVSGIYVVFRSKDPKKLPPEYLLRLLKSKTYRHIISAYDTKYGAVRANLNWEQLCRIKLAIPGKAQMEKFSAKQRQYDELKEKAHIVEEELSEIVEPKTDKQSKNPNHTEDFNKVIKLAARKKASYRT